ncbi:MAG TPA: glutamyl-tRNA reductase [Wenzhouxiangellaceae bacterium]|nr:glutamyl-tRNA reductase [Wenzhouxiangellaceae bacterium]
MSVFALGLSHQTAPVAIRERLAFTPERLGEALGAMHAVPGIRECAIVSTCNRTELYASGEHASITALQEWMHDWHGAHRGEFREYLFTLHQRMAVVHLLKVTSGMDSMVLGEPQVVGQVKQAWQSAQEHNTLGTILDRLFQHSFQTSKLVRSETGIGHNPVTLPFAALKLAHQIFGDVNRLSVLMIGAGEMIEDCARHFSSQNIRAMTICNRSPERAKLLAEQFSATPIGLDALGETLADHDMVIACTGSSTPLVDREMIREALSRRRNRPMFVLDLSVPRNVDPGVGEFGDVYLYTVDDLREIAEHGHRKRTEALDAATRIVDGQAEAFDRWLNLHAAGETLKSLRHRAFDERDKLLDQARRELAAGRDADDVLARFGHRLTNRLLHAPSMQLRRAAEITDEELMAAARKLLLDDPS